MKFIRLILIAAFLGASCTPADLDGNKLRVVTTVSPISDLATRVGGAHIHLDGLVPEGVDSHTFEPSPSDARLLSTADLVFVNGLNLEEPTLRLAKANLKAEGRLIELADTIEAADWIFDFSYPREGGVPNPHLWTNPPYAVGFVNRIMDEIVRADPENSIDYRRNASNLIRHINALDVAIRMATETVPPANRKLLTYHDSFPYFAREYGWKVIGAIQPSDFSEPTPRDVARLIEQIRELKLPAIFGSEVFPSPVLEQIAKESGAKYVNNLRDDDLPGEPGDSGHSYIGLMQFNVSVIVVALGGDASPLKGLS